MKDDMGDRMKSNYEDRAKHKLLRRMPVILRIDGKGFSTFCKRFNKPFDPLLHQAFNLTTVHLCKEVAGTVCAEHHSDEISLFLVDYQTLTTEAYFDYGIEKLVSVVAGLATAEFCKLMWQQGFLKPNERWPSFDCRAFNIPKEEVANYFWWRNRDAVRNSISMLAQGKFSHKQLHGKNSSQMQEMLFQEHGINWAHYPQDQKSGWLFVKTMAFKTIESGPRKGEVAPRSVWACIPAPANHDENLAAFNIPELTS